MADALQIFVVNAVTRDGIAENLNMHLEALGLPGELRPDDDRLTDAICQDHADGLGELHSRDCANVCQRTLVQLGLLRD